MFLKGHFVLSNCSSSGELWLPFVCGVSRGLFAVFAGDEKGLL